MAIQTFIITTVPNPAGAGAIYQVDGQNNPVLNLVRGGVYTFIQSAASNTNHPIAFKDDTGAAYTVGVVSTGVPGQTGAQTVFTVAANAPASLRYYCVTHGNNMGNTIVVTGNVSGIQTINIGNIVNDGLGDDLRTAFQKVNANFSDLSAQLTVTASNVGTTGSGVFKQKTGANLEFKNLVSGTKIALNDTGNAIVINSTAADAFTRFDTNSGAVLASVHQQITLSGTQAPGSTTSRSDIEVTVSGSSVLFKNIIPVTDVLTSLDFGGITGDFDYVTQAILSRTDFDFGTIDLPSTVDIDLGGIVV
jgi:hypothetical protein